MPKPYAQQTKGGLSGHLVRRLIHVSMALIPVIYYAYAKPAAAALHINIEQLVLAILIFTLIFEFVRLQFGWTLFGQRQHESKYIASFTWGVMAIGVVLLLAPKPFAIAIIWTCAFADPVIGELRRSRMPNPLVVLIGLLVIMAVWWVVAWLWHIPWWWALIMAPITLAAEWPILKWIDDNALMQLVPLIVVLFLLYII